MNVICLAAGTSTEWGQLVEAIGLSTKLQTVYRVLLKNPEWGMKDIAHFTGLAVGEVCEALDRLTDLTLLHRRSDSAGKFIPVNPEVGLASALIALQAELDERRTQLSRDRAALAALASEYVSTVTSRSTGSMEHLAGVDAVRVRLMELSKQARSEVRTLVPGGAPSPAALAAGQPLNEGSIARGVQLRTIFLDSARNDFSTLEYATWLASQGGAMRTAPFLPTRLLLCDDTAAVIPIDPADDRQGAYLVRSSSIVQALGELFELIWQQAAPLGAPPPAPTHGAPTGRELALLKMLATGLTDDGIARKMGVSIRTVRRNTAALFERLGAQGRFQAGAAAVRRGWM